MKPCKVTLLPLQSADRNQFVLDNQWAFKYGALEEFGVRDNHLEDDGEVISRKAIETSIDSGQAFRIVSDGRIVGGAVVKIEGKRGELELLFISPEEHSKGIGYAAWQEIEKMFPEVCVWETCTPYFEKRNIHFYVNRCGFQVVEFYNSHHHDPHASPDGTDPTEDFEMFLFKKIIRCE